MIYTKQQMVGSYMIGADVNLSVIGLFGLVESAITEGMGVLKIDGLTIKREYNAFWVFTKNRIKIFGKAPWGEVLTVQSFISNVSIAKLDVDTVLKKSDGSVIAYSRCEMCPLDAATGRIKRTSAVGVNETIVAEKPLMNIAFEKFDDGDLPLVDSVTVRSTNVDYSNHCNNVEYLRFILNTYTVAELINKPIKEIEVNYVNQSYEGDTLSVYKTTGDNRDLLSLKKNDQTVIKCVISH
ncbi:MAG: hypothetical protein J1F65_05985 [Clostridiales bacterium]|nr:hypothetical protein [Clostridiales bacterium]